MVKLLIQYFAELVGTIRLWRLQATPTDSDVLNHRGLVQIIRLV